MKAPPWCVLSAAMLGPLSPSAALGEDAAGLGPRTATQRSVIVVLPGCERPPYDASELWTALVLELGQRGLAADTDARDRSRAPDVRIDLPSCEPGVEALRVHVLGAPGAASLERRVDLLETPFEARARLLALLIAESFPAQNNERAEPGQAPEERLEPLDGKASDTTHAASSEPSGIHLGAALRGRSSLSELQLFWGAEATLRVPAWQNLDWVAEAGLAAHTESTWLGDIDMQWWSVAAGIDWSSRSDITWRVGPRLSLAHVSARGEAPEGASGTTQTDELVLLGGRTALDLPVGSSGWQLTVALDAQRALRGLVLFAGGTESVALDAWIVGAGAGLSYEL